MTERTITLDGDTWRVLSVGAFLSGKVLCHLASVTKGTQQRNGFMPFQMTDWIDVDLATSGFAHFFKRRGAWRAEVSRTPDLSEGVIDHLGPFASIYEAKDAARAKGYVIHNA
jgi:hypothetical protein